MNSNKEKIRKIYLCRHGLTDWNAQGRLQGHSDIPINDQGQRQAQALGQYLISANLLQLKFYCSHLLRAQQTLHSAGVEPTKILSDSRLAEVKLGTIEGKTEKEILEIFPADSMQRWRNLDWSDDFSFPEGETKLQSVDRMMNFLKTENSESDLFIMSHGLILRRFLGFISNNPNFERIGNTSVFLIQQNLSNLKLDYIEKKFESGI